MTNNSCIVTFMNTAKLLPNKIALVFQSQSIKYGELSEKVFHIAAVLHSQGVEPGQIVPILLPRGINIIASIFGVWHMGAIPCVVSTEYPLERIEYIKNECKTTFLLDTEWFDSMPQASANLEPTDIFIFSPEDVGLVVFTSGSTGHPKGVVIPHRALSLAIKGSMMFLKEEYSCISVGSHSFIAIVIDVLAPLLTGATLHCTSDTMRKDVQQIADYVKDQHISTSFLSPQMIPSFLALADGQLDIIFTGSERVSGIYSTKTKIINFYGASETSGPCAFFPVDKAYENTPIGKAFEGSILYLRDESGVFHKEGEGEICISGQTSLGYLNKEDLTKKVFIPNPFCKDKTDTVLFCTNDLGRFLPDGSMEYIQRKDWMLKIRGFRVEPGEIEAVMMRNKAVEKAVVIGFDDVHGQKKLYASYTVNKNTKEKITAAELRVEIEKTLPDYMIPTFIEQVDSFALTNSGKVDRKCIVPPDEQRYLTLYSAPTNEVEHTLCEAFSKLFGLDKVGIDDDFVMLGGDSISAVKFQTMVPNLALTAVNILSMRTPRLIAKEITSSISVPKHSPQKMCPVCSERHDGENIIPADTTELSQKQPILTNDNDIKMERREAYPLSQSQLGVWFDCLKNPESLTYNLPVRLEFKNNKQNGQAYIDAQRLVKAVAYVLDAHAGIKVKIRLDGENILQYPDPSAATVTFAEMSETEAENFTSGFVRLFSLTQEPLYRATVIKTPTRVILFMDIHHVVFDGMSMDIFFRDLVNAYEDNSLVNAEKIAAFDWAFEQSKQENNQDWNKAKTYFDNLFVDFEGASELPSDIQNEEKQGIMAEVICKVDGLAVKEFCKKRGLTQAVLFLASLSYAISRWTQSPHTYLCTTSSGRSDIRLCNTCGMFVKTLPLHIKLEENLTRLEYIQAARAALSGSMENDIYPFTHIVQDFGFAPIIMFAYELGIIGEYKIEGHDVEWQSLADNATKFKISVHIKKYEGQSAFVVQYDSGLYSSELIEQFSETLGIALENIMSEPHATMCSTSLVSEKQAKLLQSFNRADEQISEKVLHGMFENAVALYPQRKALIAIENTYSYAELNAEANALAHALLELGVKSQDSVAFMLNRTGRVIIAMLGILKAGCAYIPLDPEYPAERISHVLTDSGTKFLLMVKDELSDDACNELTAKISNSCQILDIDAIRKEKSMENPNLPVKPSDLAYIIYTSGSTGKPKGVMLEHKGITNYVDPHVLNTHIAAFVHNCHTMLSVTTVAFDMFLKESMSSLCNGLTLVLASENETRDPTLLSELFAATKADAFNTTPSRMLEYCEDPQFLKALQSCKVIMTGAEKFPKILLGKLRNTSNELKIYNTYGPTEITVSCNCKELTDSDKLTIGKPLLNVHEYVVDSNDNLLPVNMVGELLVGGEGVARGYVNLTKQTEERFINYNGERVYRTGDFAAWTDDGEIKILGRSDNQIKLRGLRIELGEIENALANIDNIKACAVGIRNVQGTDYICSWYVASAVMDSAYLREKLADTLPMYMLPSAYMLLEHMPKLSSAKTDLRSLPEPVLVRLSNYEAPANTLEEAFCSIFAYILGLEVVGVNDNFFDIGGSSLSVTRVIIEAKKKNLSRANGENIAYADVFKHQSPRKLATLLSDVSSLDSSTTNIIADNYDYTPLHNLLEQGTLDSLVKGEKRPLGNVMLTGAAGFLGVHILNTLLNDEEGKIYCLLRKGNHTSVEQRLKQILFYYFEDAYASLINTRIFAVEGDIAQANSLNQLDLPQDFTVDTLINCAANVSHFAVDSSISDVNLGGVENLIDFALKHKARLIQISTSSVSGFSIDNVPPIGTRLTEQILYSGQNLDNQYIYSKFMAERVILQAVTKGLDAKIMRVGNLMARSKDGEFQINLRSNSFIGRLRAYKTIGAFPYSSFLHQVELAPIDITAKSILLLAQSPDSCHVFHPYNNHKIYLGDIITTMQDEGIPIRLVEDAEFISALSEASKDDSRAEKLVSLIAYQNMAQGKKTISVPADNDYTTQCLLRYGLRWTATGHSYLQSFIRGLISLGFFN